MGTLDWSKLNTDQLRLSVTAGKGEIHELRMELTLPILEKLIGELRPIYAEGTSARGAEVSKFSEDAAIHTQGRLEELRLMLPAGWTLFFKQQLTGPARLMVAHPDPEVWVGTLLLPPLQGLQILTEFSGMLRRGAFRPGGPQDGEVAVETEGRCSDVSFRDQLPKDRAQSLFSSAVNNLNLTVSLLGS